MLNKFRVIHLNCTSCDFASPLARSGANNKASVSLVAICSDMFRLASRRSQMSYQPHDLPLLVLHSWGARGHTARLRAAHAASRAEDARSYTPTGGFQLVLLPLFHGIDFILGLDVPVQDHVLLPSSPESSDDCGTVSLITAPAVGSGGPSPNTLPTTMIPVVGL